MRIGSCKRTTDDPGQKLKRHIIHHDGDDDLVRAEASTQPTNEPPIDATANTADQQKQQQGEPAETLPSKGASATAKTAPQIS